MADRILVLTDGSDCADRALDHAFARAETEDAVLHVLHVIDVSYPATGAPTPINAWDEAMDALEDHAEGTMSAIVERGEKRGVDVETAVRRSTDLLGAIHDHVDEVEPDLIVMGTHGRTGLRRAILGSVTDRVLRIVSVPVLVVPVSR